MNRQKVTVAVTGLNNIDSPGPGIPVIRGIQGIKGFRCQDNRIGIRTS